jgi:LPXTG-motif cell wall-anchored protein
MSFQTEKPFFPYREPASQRAAGKGASRLLRVYFIADARFDGAIGKDAYWPGKPVWSDQIETAQLAKLLSLAKLPPMAGGGGRWLTEFEDQSSPRPGTDEVFFARVRDQSPLARPAGPISSTSNTFTFIAAGIFALVIVVALVLYKRRRRGNRRLFD